MKFRRCITCLLACLPLWAGCGKKPSPPAPPARSERPAAVDEPPTPVFGKPWTVPALGLGLVVVTEGSFMMGSKDGRDNEKPVHQVRITRPFWMGRYEVTQREYEAVVGSNPSYFRKGAVLNTEERDGLWGMLFGPKDTILTVGTSNCPAETVAWADAVAFCTDLTVRERRAGRLPTGYEYRLPTEAEWEYAARGGPGGRDPRYAGSDDPDEVAWHSGNSGRKAHEVCSRGDRRSVSPACPGSTGGFSFPVGYEGRWGSCSGQWASV